MKDPWYKNMVVDYFSQEDLQIRMELFCLMLVCENRWWNNAICTL